MNTGIQWQELPDADLNLICGGIHVIGGPAPVAPPIWTHQPPPQGPILITCIVGKGCMTKPA